MFHDIYSTHHTTKYFTSARLILCLISKIWIRNFLSLTHQMQQSSQDTLLFLVSNVQNYHEAKAFTDEVARNLDAKFCPAVDLGVYKSLQNFRLYMNCKVGSSRVKQYKSGVFKAFSDLLIAYIPEGSFKLPSILARKAVKNAPKIETELRKSRLR